MSPWRTAGSMDADGMNAKRAVSSTGSANSQNALAPAPRESAHCSSLRTDRSCARSTFTSTEPQGIQDWLLSSTHISQAPGPTPSSSRDSSWGREGTSTLSSPAFQGPLRRRKSLCISYLCPAYNPRRRLDTPAIATPPTSRRSELFFMSCTDCRAPPNKYFTSSMNPSRSSGKSRECKSLAKPSPPSTAGGTVESSRAAPAPSSIRCTSFAFCGEKARPLRSSEYSNALQPNRFRAPACAPLARSACTTPTCCLEAAHIRLLLPFSSRASTSTLVSRHSLTFVRSPDLLAL
mmetsp:Transcript_2786/g.3788  ORF Transcript_2786/g.3788 Transcript_2786/m.3788 type:complete len:292 (-) Transcript_2786:439-1314(-)